MPLSPDQLSRVRDLLGPARSVVSFSGAGLSAESGVPTFRDAATGGLWSRYDPMRLASPEGFAADPELVLKWYAWRRAIIAGAEPNAAHRALAARRDIVQVTQNVDDLLQRAGGTDVIQLHGTIGRDRCHRGCGFDRPAEVENAEPVVEPCPHCSAPLRPAVVWFGESLPPEAWERATEAATACDVLLVVGTSAGVYPAAGLIELARGAGAAIVVVNTARSGASALADIELIGPAGELIPALV